MPAISRLSRLVVALIAALLVASCGGDGEGGGKRNPGRGDKESACPDKLPIAATKLPSGFSDNAVKGPAAGNREIENVRIWHYNGPEAKFIEVFRGGQRHKFTKGTPMRALETIARVGKIDGGYAAKIRLGRGRCSRYVYEGRGVSEGELKNIVTGLKRSGAED
jgi:hypothetical protein